MLKIDQLTSIHSKGKFARICVEIDLRKSLIPKINVMGLEIHLEYEGLHQICFGCGMYGHKLEQCGVTMSKNVTPVQDDDNREIPPADANGGASQPSTVTVMETIDENRDNAKNQGTKPKIGKEEI
ncbi:hypothetical protein RIF29_39821 [Crotalaria pallida]|uniref:CCHC-type domain-containing protein n=1 Tax=Crotalaria pallida TaxID=3830 RepID=A0AAN9E4E2_CROPI